MELYERVLRSKDFAIQCGKYRNPESPFTSDGEYIFVRGVGRIAKYTFDDDVLRAALLEELNEVWKKYTDKRFDQLKHAFMAEFMQDGRPDDG